MFFCADPQKYQTLVPTKMVTYGTLTSNVEALQNHLPQTNDVYTVCFKCDYVGNATCCKITARAPLARRQTSARYRQCVIKTLCSDAFTAEAEAFPGGDTVHQQGIVHSHKLISKECMTSLLHLHKAKNVISDTEKKEEKSVLSDVE